MQRHGCAAALFAALIACAALFETQAGARSGRAHFDYYLLSLSWSPSYCLSHRDEPDECGRHGFGFVLHGLWPQYRNGGWPQHCGTHTAPDAGTVARTLAIMPSRRLIEHEWQAHGSCTGMDPRAYFATAERAYSGIAIPQALRTPQTPPALSAGEIARAFAEANPGLGRSMLSVVCRAGSELAEVRVCLRRDTLAPQACAGRVRDSCRYGKLRIPAAR
jgi:ribonuclease T2